MSQGRQSTHSINWVVSAVAFDFVQELRHADSRVKVQDDRLTQLLACAALEDLREDLEGKLATTIAAQRERRLISISKHVFKGQLPNQEFVRLYFGLTESEARSLLRRTRARHHRVFAGSSKEALKEAMKRARKVDTTDNWQVAMDSWLAEEANGLIRSSNPGVPPVSSNPDTVGTVVIREGSFKVLLDALDLEVSKDSVADKGV